MSNPTRFRDIEIRAPRGNQLTAKSWLTEAPLRMLMNNQIGRASCRERV